MIREDNRALFNNIAAQQVVDSLKQGQKSYIDECMEKQRVMAISNGCAWTRPNHIDDAFAKANFFRYQLKFAG